jgi:hypothetical protein
MAEDFSDDYSVVRDISEEPEELDLEQIQARYDPNYFDQEDFAEIERKTRLIHQSTFRLDYIKHLSNFSYLNELPNEISFYCLLAAITKDLKLKLNGKELMMKLHMIWQQDSGTGKGAAFEEIAEIIKEYNKISDKPLKIANFDGSETLQSFYNSYLYEKGKFNISKPIQGILEQIDLLLLEECSYIFAEKRGQQQTKSEIFLKALESKPLEKSLAGYRDEASGKASTTITYPNFIMLASTRLVEEVKSTLATSGFLQRFLPVFRNISQNESREMVQKDNVNSQFSGEKIEMLKKERELLALKMLEYRNWLKANPIFTYEDAESCSNLINKHILEIQSEAFKSLSIWEHQEIALSFVRRTTKKIISLCALHAAMRKSSIITLVDINIVCGLFKALFRQLFVWIEETIEEGKTSARRSIMLNAKMRKIKKAKGKAVFRDSELVGLIVEETGFSRDYAKKILYKHPKIFIPLKDDKYQVRTY